MGNVIRPKGLLELQLREANIGEDYWGADFLNYQGPDNAKEASMKYLKKLDKMKENGVGLLYVGPNGPGKTTAAMIIFKYLIRARWNVYATSLGELTETIQASWNKQESVEEDPKERCRRADFLLIDDVGKEHRGQSGFVQTVFDNLIRYRVQHRNPTFLTSNYTKTELEGTYGESVMSLLAGKLVPVTVGGDDHRQTVLKKEIRNEFKT